MFITPAFAQTGGSMSDPFTGLLIPMLLMVLIFYFLVIRPQSQRSKQHREMIERVRRGDTVVTSGGFIGKVSRRAGHLRRDRGRSLRHAQGSRSQEHASRCALARASR